MQEIGRKLINKRNFRHFWAAAFLVFLLAEWGSHSLAFAHSFKGEGHAVHVEEGHHDDLCKTLIRCSDGPGQEQLVPTFGHYTLQHNTFFDNLANDLWRGPVHKDPRIHRSRIRGLFRAVSPPYHPPELS